MTWKFDMTSHRVTKFLKLDSTIFNFFLLFFFHPFCLILISERACCWKSSWSSYSGECVRPMHVVVCWYYSVLATAASTHPSVKWKRVKICKVVKLKSFKVAHSHPLVWAISLGLLAVEPKCWYTLRFVWKLNVAMWFNDFAFAGKRCTKRQAHGRDKGEYGQSEGIWTSISNWILISAFHILIFATLKISILYHCLTHLISSTLQFAFISWR